MEATVATLHHEIESEERRVGIRVHGPVPPRLIARRRHQIAAMLAAVVVALVGVAFMPATPVQTPALRVLTIALAVLCAAYAVEQERHLRRLSTLSADARRISAAVADALSASGALRVDDELLLVRDELRAASDRLAADLRAELAVDDVAVHVPGPSGELPSRGSRAAARRGETVETRRADGRAAVAVPVALHGAVVAVFEVTAPAGVALAPSVHAFVAAYGRGALGTLRA
jgi:hypothetical protein